MSAVHPDPCVDAAHTIQEQHRGGQGEYRVGIDRVPLGGGQFEVQAQFCARLAQGAPVQVLAERQPVPGIQGSTVNVAGAGAATMVRHVPCAGLMSRRYG